MPRPLPSLSLSNLEPFAKGGHRRLYVHPDDHDLCVKVPARTDDAKCHVEQERDIKDSLALSMRGSQTVFAHIAPVLDVVETDFGTGIVQCLYRDADGRIARSLADAIRDEGLTPRLTAALDEFKRWLRKERLPPRGLIPANLVVVPGSGGNLRLVLIEGFLNRKFASAARQCGPLSDFLIGRRLHRLDVRISKLSTLRPVCPTPPARPN